MFLFFKTNWFSSSETDGFKFSDCGLDIQTRKFNSNASRQVPVYIPNNDVMQKNCPTCIYISSLNCTNYGSVIKKVAQETGVIFCALTV